MSELATVPVTALKGVGAALAEKLARVDALIGPGAPNAERERQFRRRARGTMSPGEIATCIEAMHVRAQYAA